MDTSNESGSKAPLLDRSAQKAAILTEWEAADKANPLPAPAPSEEQRMTAEDTAVEAPITERPANEAAVDAELEKAAATETQTAKAVPEPQDPTTLRGLQAIEARDKKLRTEHQQRQFEIRQYESQLRAEQQRLAAEKQRFEEEKRQAILDPAAFFRGVGVDKGFREIAEQLYVSELGPNAPPELVAKSHIYRVQQEQRRQGAELDQMRAHIEQERKQLENQRVIEKYRQELHAGLAQLPPKFQYMTSIAKRDPGRALDLMWNEAVAYAQQNPDEGIPPTAEMLADLVEKKFSPFSGDPKSPNPVNAGEKRTAPPVNQHHTGRTATRPTPKTRDELREEIRRRLEAGDID